MELSLIVERETDGRWIAEVPELPGVMVYGASQAEAMANAEVLAMHVVADRHSHGDEKNVRPPSRSSP